MLNSTGLYVDEVLTMVIGGFTRHSFSLLYTQLFSFLKP